MGWGWGWVWGWGWDWDWATYINEHNYSSKQCGHDKLVRIYSNSLNHILQDH